MGWRVPGLANISGAVALGVRTTDIGEQQFHLWHIGGEQQQLLLRPLLRPFCGESACALPA